MQEEDEAAEEELWCKNWLRKVDISSDSGATEEDATFVPYRSAMEEEEEEESHFLFSQFYVLFWNFGVIKSGLKFKKV